MFIVYMCISQWHYYLMKNSPETLKKRNELRRKWRKEIALDSFPHKILKKCKNCKKTKLCDWSGSFTQTGSPEYKARCHDCHRIKALDWRRKGQKRISQQAKLRRLKLKQKYVDYLGGKCSRCGYFKNNRALTFHHHGKGKDRNISQMIDWSWNKVKSELDRCILLCFNCHMEEHDENDM